MSLLKRLPLLGRLAELLKQGLTLVAQFLGEFSLPQGFLGLTRSGGCFRAFAMLLRQAAQQLELGVQLDFAFQQGDIRLIVGAGGRDLRGFRGRRCRNGRGGGILGLA